MTAIGIAKSRNSANQRLAWGRGLLSARDSTSTAIGGAAGWCTRRAERQRLGRHAPTPGEPVRDHLETMAKKLKK